MMLALLDVQTTDIIECLALVVVAWFVLVIFVPLLTRLFRSVVRRPTHKAPSIPYSIGQAYRRIGGTPVIVAILIVACVLLYQQAKVANARAYIAEMRAELADHQLEQREMLTGRMIEWHSVLSDVYHNDYRDS